MREHMFDKVLTSTDVGKRLVIPKEYALNYFPLNHNQTSPILLDFQDRNGKTWRFHYYCFSSCQNYVLIKGWIHFVRQKKLCARDTVSFHRSYISDDNSPERRRKILFIDWRQERTETGASVSDNNNYFYNSEMREHMFDKVLTPSDVAKNRLMIPKDYALNYFPLDHNRKGPILMDFQDRNGKTWRFHYFYWFNRCYVMTKGWTHFVNEMKLCAGDTVSFHRGYIPDDNAPERRRKIMFIDWRHEINLVQNINQECTETGASGSGNNNYFYNSEMRELAVPPLASPHPSTTRKMRLFGVDMEESSSSGERHGKMGGVGHSPSSPIMINDDDQSSWRLPRGKMGASSSTVIQLSDDEEYKRRGKSLAF